MTRYSPLLSRRLRLRAVEPSDADFIWAADNDSSQWALNGMLAPVSRENILLYASTYDADPLRAGELRLVIESREEGTPVGIIDLYEISALHQRALTGIYIVPSRRGEGLAQEALDAIAIYARDLLNLRILGARIVEGNLPSLRLFEKCGYRRSGTLPGWILCSGTPRDLYLFTKKL